MATGWTWEYVWENMTFQRLEVFMRIWKQTPPPNVSLGILTTLLKHFMGVEENRSPIPPGEDLATLSDFEE